MSTRSRSARVAVRSLLTGGFLAAAWLLLGPSASADAAEVPIDLYASAGTASFNGTSVPVWGYTDDNSAVTAPGGPSLEVNQGDVVTITLHNGLSENTSLYLGGQVLVPDTTGAAPGATSTYTFTASSPGTYLYEAGLTPNSQHQVAMGLYGSLVVNPATTGQAYDDASTAYDAQETLVLSQFDPAMTSNPAAFDMRNFKPKYFLVNGKVHPQTTPITTASGQKVLLRYVNAGADYRSMGVLGAAQHLVALDGSLLSSSSGDISRSYVAETFGPGQTADAIVTVPTTATDRRLAVYDASLSLHNSNTPGSGGMLTFIDVTGSGATTPDTSGPATTNVAWDETTQTLSAHVSDAATGGSTVQAAEAYVNDIGGTPYPMSGTFGGDPVDVSLSSTGLTDALALGENIVYVRGQDGSGNWGPFSTVLVMGADGTGPTTSGVAVTPAQTNGSVDVTVSATGNDTASGNSDIAGAQWSLDGSSWTAMTVETSGPVAGVTGIIPAVTVAGRPEGDNTVYVRTQDAAGNWGDPATATLVVDTTGPLASDLSVTPNPNNGTIPVNGSSPAVRLSATLTDTLTNIAKAEAFIDSPTSTAIPMEASDGAFNGLTENVYLDIPLTTVKQMSEGEHKLYVRGRDAAGNWSALDADGPYVVLLVDKSGPVIGGVSITPNPTNGATTATLSGTATDASGVARVEWYIGSDPGVGNATAATLTGSTFSAAIDVDAFNEGTYTVNVRATDILGQSTKTTVALQVTHSMRFSTLGSTAAMPDPGDIYRWSGTAFSQELDLQSAPYSVPGGANVDGFSRLDATQFYVSFSANVTLPGAGAVQPQDVAFWNGSTWSVFFRGQTNGVRSQANLDALSVRNGTLYFSISDNSTPGGGGGGGDDADIYRWNGGSSYTVVFDASANGLGNNANGTANVDGLAWTSATDLYLSFSQATTSVSGIGTVQDEDVVRLRAGSWSVFIDGTGKGLTADNQDVDAFDIP
jgi:hypothetical protein